LAIGGLLVWILSTQVNYRLLSSPLIARRFAEAFVLVVQIVVVSSLLSVTLGVLVGLGRISTSNVTGRIAKGYSSSSAGRRFCPAVRHLLRHPAAGGRRDSSRSRTGRCRPRSSG